MNPIRKKLVELLYKHADTFVSGEEISRHLQVTRTAIWKHIEALRQEGYQIEAVRKQGYKLIAEPKEIGESNLLPHLSTSWLGQTYHYYPEVESTQRIAHEKAQNGAPAGTLILADQQTQGKGRMGRKWYSPPETGIWMSVILRPDQPLSTVPQLTLLTSIAVLKGIAKATGIELKIKWPNDLLYGTKKVAGILTELNAETDHVNYVIVGVGLNLNQTENDFPAELKDIATSLRIEKKEKLDRKRAITSMLQEWETLYDFYMDHGFSPIKTLWETYSASLGKHIRARTLQGDYEGIATGITDEGILLLEDQHGHVRKIYSADIETF